MDIEAGFTFLDSKITVNCDCSHEIIRHLLPGRKAVTNVDSILKSRHHLANKGQSYEFSFPGDSDGKESTCSTGDQGRSLGQEDPPKKGMATHSSILAWRMPWTEEPGGL